jgi:hypothetical protein
MKFILKHSLLTTYVFFFIMIGTVCAQEKNLYLLDAKKNKSQRISNGFKLHYQLLTDTVEKSQKFLGVVNDSIIMLKNENININNISFVRKTTTGQKIKKGFGGFLLGVGGYIVLGSLYEMLRKDTPQGEDWEIEPGAGLLIGAFIAFPGYVMLDVDAKKYSLGVRYRLTIK